MRRVAASILIFLLGYTDVHAQAPEYQVKAAMLANFALFVDWPATAFASADSPFYVCVLGRDPFGPWLGREMGERVGTHPVRIRTLDRAEDAGACHILFVSRSEGRRLGELLSSLRGSGTLVVSDVEDSDEFCRQGGMIAMTMENRKLRFELNAAAAEREGFHISSRLKRLAGSTDCGKGR